MIKRREVKELLKDWRDAIENLDTCHLGDPECEVFAQLLGRIGCPHRLSRLLAGNAAEIITKMVGAEDGNKTWREDMARHRVAGALTKAVENLVARELKADKRVSAFKEMANYINAVIKAEDPFGRPVTAYDKGRASAFCEMADHIDAVIKADDGKDQEKDGEAAR